jgi:hypothetical protein
MEKIDTSTILYRNKFTKQHIKGQSVNSTIHHYRSIIRSGKYVPSKLSNSHNTIEILVENILKKQSTSNIIIKKN